MIFSHTISKLFEEYTSSNNVDSIKGYLQQIILEHFPTFPHLAKLFDSGDFVDIPYLATTFSQIGQFFRIKFPALDVSVSDSSTQTMTITSFAEIFQHIQKMNVHQNVDSSMHDTAFPKVVIEPVCQCAYHEEELFDHLHISAIVTGIIAIRDKRDKRDKRDVFNSMLTALLHDIGKPACIRIFDKGHVGYPYHGEYGALILSRLYNPNFALYISQADYEIMCRTISVHMCSYHMTDFQSNWNKDRVNSTRAESDAVKDSLMNLSYGDVFSAFSPMNNSKAFVETRAQYKQMISEPYILSGSKFVFVMNGRSGSGKSFVSNILISFVKSLGKSVNHIQRDIIIANVVRAAQGLDQIDHRPTSDEYRAYYAYYKEHKLASAVNGIFKNLIQNSISKFDVTIIDTQLTLFRGVDQIIPSNIDACTVISFDVSRNMVLDDDSKNGVSIQTQLGMFGKSTVLTPLDMDGVIPSSVASAYTHNSRPIGFAPDFVFALGYNEYFNGKNTIGISYFKDFFSRMITSSTSGVALSINTNDMDLVEYVNHLYNANDKSYDSLCETLRSQCYHVATPFFLRGSSYETQFLSIKYLDHNNNWSKWGRETRGTTLVLIDGKWTWLKFLMQRGAEMLTGMQVKRGIVETDNVDTKLDFKASHLSQDQQSLIHDLHVGNPVNLALSFKKDGSLLSCCLYTGAMAVMMRQIINAHGDTFAKTVMQTYDDVNNSSDDVFVFQSQSTLLLGVQMYDYTTTAIFPEADPKLPPIEKVKQYGSSFFKRMHKMFAGIPGIVKHVLGETICANRTESYSGIIHTELAVSYPHSSFTVLSSTSIFEDSYKVSPHYEFSDLIHKCGFSEPAFWKVNTVAEVDALIQGVDACIFQRMTTTEFYAKFKPSNKFKYDEIIDYEGFVTYDANRENSYGKIKTDSYYKAHKLRDDNVGFLCDLNKVAGHIFPLARIVAQTVTELDGKLDIINVQLVELISSDKMIEFLNPKAAKGFAQRPRELQFKIIINTAKDKFSEFAFEIFQSHFPSLVSSDDMKSFIVKYAMETKLWQDVFVPIDADMRSHIVYTLIGYQR